MPEHNPQTGNPNMNATADHEATQDFINELESISPTPPADEETLAEQLGLALSADEQQFANAAPGYDASEPQQPAAEQPAAEQAAYEPVVTGDGATEIKNAGDFGKKLRQQTIAVRLMRKQWGIVKKLTRAQVETAADQFGADANRLGASKKLINRRAKAFRNCVATISTAVAYWRESTVPYPELGVRLMRKDRLNDFNQRILALKAELASYVMDLKIAYNNLVQESREHLGSLFNITDYPTADTLDQLFALDVDFPAIEPNSILKQLNPALYEQELKRVQARFDTAVVLAEEAFSEQFKELVANLAERLKVGEDGKPKQFRDAAVTGLSDFFAKFKELNVGNNAELDSLVAQAQELIKGGDAALAKSLRKDMTLRQSTQVAFAELSAKLEKSLVTKPSRKLFMEDDFVPVADEAAADEAAE